MQIHSQTGAVQEPLADLEERLGPEMKQTLWHIADDVQRRTFKGRLSLFLSKRIFLFMAGACVAGITLGAVGASRLKKLTE